MKVSLENKYACTEEVYLDIYKYLYFTNKLYIGVGIVYVVLCILFNAASLAGSNGINLPSILSLVFLYGITNFAYRRKAKNQYKRDLESNMNKPSVSIFTIKDEYINIKNGNAAYKKIFYTDIKKVENAEKLFLLRTHQNLALVIRKDSFTQGTVEEFEAFLKEKGFKFRSSK